MGGRGPVVGRDRHGRLGEHQVGDDRSPDAAGHLGGQVSAGIAPAQPAEGGVDERHHRVEVRPRHRPEHQDDGEEPGRGRRRVLEQLESDVAGRELLRGDARADDDGGQEGAPEQLGDRRRHSAARSSRPQSARGSCRRSAAGRGRFWTRRRRARGPRSRHSPRSSIPARSRPARRPGRCRPPRARRRGRSPTPCPGRRSSRSSTPGRRARGPRPEPPGGRLDLLGGVHLHAQMVERTGHAGAAGRGVLDQDQLEGGSAMAKLA